MTLCDSPIPLSVIHSYRPVSDCLTSLMTSWLVSSLLNIENLFANSLRITPSIEMFVTWRVSSWCLHRIVRVLADMESRLECQIWLSGTSFLVSARWYSWLNRLIYKIEQSARVILFECDSRHLSTLNINIALQISTCWNVWLLWQHFFE